ncbi:MAG: cytochrome c biogenesis protein ResB [Aeromicrobium sp.]|uniref:cytochrome c biogenesis protein ResB n=1 Tax=Aeromicrobium sp. TaxID=1871063 RepID=UPI0039E3BF34
MSPPSKRQGAAPALGPWEFARWIWTQLTSMRTALMMLLLLAVAALPGSFVPQTGVDARAVEAFRLRHPDLSPWLERLGVFHVYSSPWFSAVYLLLMVSLIGCILPRARVYWRALRSRPPKAPKRFERLPASGSFETSADVETVLAEAKRLLGRARIDVVVEDEAGEVRAERGYLREFGNLLFHVSVVVVLVGVAAGALLGYRGTATITEGDRFSNVLTQYDEFSSGTWFDPDDLPAFSVQLDDLVAKFQLDGPQRGAPRLFEADGTFVEGVDGEPEAYSIRVNHPLSVGSTDVFLVGQGYSPVLKVTDAEGNVVFDEAVPFLPEDATYTSGGVVKVPDAQPEQLGMRGFFLPTAVTMGEDEASVSLFPAAANPYLAMQAWSGDLGLDEGTPQSVYVLDTDEMTQMTNEDGDPFRIELQPGQETTLPDGTVVEFVELRQFARFQIASSPLARLPLGGVVAGLCGLVLSLFVRPRRTWVRARRDGSRTVVEVAALDRVPRDDLPEDLTAFIGRLRAAVDPQEPS